MLVLLAERADTRNYTGERPRNTQGLKRGILIPESATTGRAGGMRKAP